MPVHIGTAGWSVPSTLADLFPSEGSALERYAVRFGAAEINSSFHRSHRRSTWERWAASVPADFRFSVKLPKAITHQAKLAGCDEPLADFLAEIAPLGDRLAVLLVQLPPSLAFDPVTAGAFFERLARSSSARLACEPRHPSWFEPEADALLARHQVARVAADPARVPEAALPGGWQGLAYWRLHGSPVMYRSSYDGERLERYARDIGASRAPQRWCIFDNTASSAATSDALALQQQLTSSSPES